MVMLKGYVSSTLDSELLVVVVREEGASIVASCSVFLSSPGGNR
jgi:hypothetical protein